MSIKLNIVANYISSAWGALVSLLFIPVYIAYLGIESYGLIGVFALLQTSLALFDMGMTPALSRAMAQHTAGASTIQSIRNLLRSIEWVVCVMSVAIALGIWLASDWLASSWLKAEGLSRETVSCTISIMGVVIGLRLGENIYRSSIVGLQRQVLLSVITIATTTLRSVGAVVVLILVTPTITVFFVWQCIASIVTVAAYFVVMKRILPAAAETARFSTKALHSISRFAGGMVAISALSLVVMELDKLLLSRLLPLAQFAHYVLAGTVAKTAYLLSAPLMVAIYPRMVALLTHDDQESLRGVYHLSAQMVTVLLGAATVTLMVFSERLLLLWTADTTLAVDVAPILSVLALGTLMNGLAWVPYQLQLAYGWTELSIKMNIGVIAVAVPAIFWVVPRYGAVGAAWVWVLVNAAYLTFGIHFMHRRLLQAEKWSWYCNDLSIPLIGATLTAVVCRSVFPQNLGRVGEFAVLAVSSLCVLVATALLAPIVRHRLVVHLYSVAIRILRRRGRQLEI
jgi:O-antigen/teichoic acid export membrane protein